MLAPIFSDPAFNQGLLDIQHKLRDAVARGAASVSVGAQAPTRSPPLAYQSSSTSDAPPSERFATRSTDEVEGKSDDGQQRTADDQEDKPSTATKELNVQEQRLLTTLEEIDRRVRAHEQAHLNAAQGLAVSRANFSYEVGPDEKRYAIAGEVTIDTSAAAEPGKTIDKGYRIIRTALAPADPSPQDLSVANRAQLMIQEAQAELMRASYDQNHPSGTNGVGQIFDQQV
jgi:hypothetical protein